MKKLFPLLFLWPLLTWGQVKLPNFPASPGVLGTDLTWDDTGALTQKATFAQVASYVTGQLPSLLTCSANQLVYDTISGLACNPALTWNSGAFQVGSLANGNETFFFQVDGAMGAPTDGNVIASWTDFVSTHFATAPDNLAVATNGTMDYMDIWRNVNGLTGVCGAQGTITAAYLPCRITLATNGGAFSNSPVSGVQVILGPLDPPGTSPYDEGFRIRCFDNDSCGFLNGNHRTGSTGYGWTYSYTGPGPSTRFGTMTEHVPAQTTTAASAQRQPHVTGALNGSVTGSISSNTLTTTGGTATLAVGQTVVFPGSTPAAYMVWASLGGSQYTLSQPCVTTCTTLTGSAYNELAAGYEGWMTSGGSFVWQMSDGGTDSDLGGPLAGTTFAYVAKTAGTSQVNVTLGENTNPSSVTNIVGGSPGNTQVNSRPMVGAAGSWTNGNCAALQSSTDAIADLGTTCQIVVNYIATANVATLSGSQTITVPGVAGATATVQLGTSILLTGQTVTQNNGVYFVPGGGGAWVPLGIFQTGYVIPQYTNLVVRDTTTGSIFTLNTTASNITVGTTSQTWNGITGIFSAYNQALTVGPAANPTGAGTSATYTAGDSSTSSGAGGGGLTIVRGGNASTLTSGVAIGGGLIVEGGKGGSTAANGTGGVGEVLGGAGSTTTSGNSTGGDGVVQAGPKGSGTGSNGNSRIKDANAKTWILVNDTVASNLPTQTSNGGITCNSNSNGSFMAVSDATSPINGAAYTNGGSTPAQIYCNGTSWLVTNGGASPAYSHESYQPGLLTSIVNTKSIYATFVKASTVDNIKGSAQSLTTCTTNPTITMYECGTDASCASPTTIGSVTITATGQRMDGTVSNAAIAAGDSIAWAISAGACASLDIGATAQIHSN
ncbi:MAG TPA: hypothetical protein VLH80_07425 [Nitrospiraceae bacterium]|nr:hypothetical protein [Nitrospiraceae bacterium]